MRCRILFAAAALLAACTKETVIPVREDAPPAATKTIVEPPKDLAEQKVDTTIPVEPPPVSRCDVKESFAAKEPIDFTMVLSEAPAKLHVSVRAMQGHEEIAFARLPAEGKGSVTLRVPPLDPGKYTLVGLWGGNEACRKAIEVKK